MVAFNRKGVGYDQNSYLRVVGAGFAPVPAGHLNSSPETPLAFQFSTGVEILCNFYFIRNSLSAVTLPTCSSNP